MKMRTYWAAALLFALASCSSGGEDDPVTPTPSPEPDVTTPSTDEGDLASYVAPTYADNYTSIAGWENRKQWNLANVHDPSVMLAEDGYYYMYQTDASYGNAHSGHGHFHARRSKNLVDWEYLGYTMANVPSWVNPKLNEIRTEMGLESITPADSEYGYWAPCARKVKSGLYRMYYSIIVDRNLNGSNSWGERSFIGVMETSDPSSNKWTDKGFVITNPSDRGLNFNVSPSDWQSCYYKFNCIDPSYFIDNDGRHWLIYGSWNSGIAIVELDAETGKVKAELPTCFGTSDDVAAYGQLIYTRKMGDRWQGSEGPEIVYHDGYYYLFLAYDALAVPYNTRVVRAKSITGPYMSINGTDCTNVGGEAFPIVTHPYKFNNDQGWVGVSHCAVFDDGNDNWFFSSQGRMPENVAGIAASNAIMMGQVRRLVWTESGWPVVMPERYGAVPSVAITKDDIAGEYEHITLTYDYGKQNTSVSAVFESNGTITSGPWANTTWTFDATNSRIRISNGLTLEVRREVDWEASPRKATLVYAGIDGQKTYWGKKK
jgi:beta-xylosidase